MRETLDYINISDRSVLLPLFSKMFIFSTWKIDIKRLWIVSMKLFYCALLKCCVTRDGIGWCGKGVTECLE